MNYSWASITKSCINRGNFLIEFALQKILQKNGFDKPNFIFDSIKPESDKIIEQINKTDFLIVPGCTTLTVEDYPALKKILPSIKIPIFNLGAAFSGNNSKPPIDDLKYFFKPIGTRDPFSHDYLNKHKMPNIFIGCPTLLLGQAESFQKRDNKKIVFFFGYKEIDWQKRILKSLINKNYEISVIVQEEKQKDIIKNLPVKIVEYDIKNVLKEIKRARLMITARLHGALPAISLGTPLFFIKTMEDKRFDLLDYLGIKMNNINNAGLQNNLDLALNNPLIENSQKIYKKVNYLRKKYLNYIKLIKGKIND